MFQSAKTDLLATKCRLPKKIRNRPYDLRPEELESKSAQSLQERVKVDERERKFAKFSLVQIRVVFGR